MTKDEDRDRASFDRVLSVIDAIPSERRDDETETISVGALRLLRAAFAKADAILSLSTPVVGGGADSLVDAATGGRFSSLTAFTEAMLSADDDVSLDEMVGEAATLLHALAGSRLDPRTMDRAGMAQEVE